MTTNETLLNVVGEIIAVCLATHRSIATLKATPADQRPLRAEEALADVAYIMHSFVDALLGCGPEIRTSAERACDKLDSFLKNHPATVPVANKLPC